MQEIQHVSSQYRPFAVASSSIYFTLEQLEETFFLYHFSLPFFLVIVDSILGKPSQNLKAEKDPMARLKILMTELFNTTFVRAARGLLQKDQIAFALRLSQVRPQLARLCVELKGCAQIWLEESGHLGEAAGAGKCVQLHALAWSHNLCSWQGPVAGPDSARVPDEGQGADGDGLAGGRCACHQRQGADHARPARAHGAAVHARRLRARHQAHQLQRRRVDEIHRGSVFSFSLLQTLTLTVAL